MKRIIWFMALAMCLINAGCQKEPAKIVVEAVTLNITSISLTEGESAEISATVSPSNATNQKVVWTTSNPSVATVENGLVKAISAGSATVTVTSDDGGRTATCEVTVTPAVLLVDLGLSVKWAACNLGASNPEEYGGYYQWGGLEDVTDTSIDLYWGNCPYHTGSNSSTGWTKYIPIDKSSYWSGSGSPDNKIVLDPEDDVAHVKLGGKWRMPTKTEFDELVNNCQCDWVTSMGVNGIKFTSKKSGYADKWIFLPAAGLRLYDDLRDTGSEGCYWSSSLRTGYPSGAGSVNFESDRVGSGYADRSFGFSVRPVSD